MYFDNQTMGKTILSFMAIAAAITVSIHAVLRRRNHHAATWWITLSWMLPIVGPLLYGFFGINRIQRKAAKLRRDAPPRPDLPSLTIGNGVAAANSMSESMQHLAVLERVIEKAVKLPLTKGNLIRPMFNGDEAFPRMLEAIDQAKRSIGLSTYIFNNDRIGKRFIEKLTNAASRGVKVRVLIDDIGSGFQWRSIYQEFTKLQVPVAYFMPTLVPWRLAYFNLRSHRKILSIDGQVAFTGGMNIVENHQVSFGLLNTAEDIHFQVEGPVVTQIQDVFRTDWHFTTGEFLDGPDWFPTLHEVGDSWARGIPDGPDEDFENCKLTLLGALAHAKKSILILTPYLIPDQSLISALNLAALGGIEVDVVLPSSNDMALVGWATQAYLWQLLERGVRVWRTPPPFHHGKIMIVDNEWVHFGSSNWDPRSLRLNFEFNVECYSNGLAKNLTDYIHDRISKSHQITLAEVDSRPFLTKLRDGTARLFSPML